MIAFDTAAEFVPPGCARGVASGALVEFAKPVGALLGDALANPVDGSGSTLLVILETRALSFCKIGEAERKGSV